MGILPAYFMGYGIFGTPYTSLIYKRINLYDYTLFIKLWSSRGKMVIDRGNRSKNVETDRSSEK